MTEPANETNAIDEVLDRLSRASGQIVKAVEDQARQIDQRTRDFVDRTEAATERLLKRLEEQSRVQIDALRREVAQFERRIGGSRQTAATKPAPGTKAAAKQASGKKSPGKKSPGKKAAGKKAAGKKAAGKKAAGKKAAANKTA